MMMNVTDSVILDDIGLANVLALKQVRFGVFFATDPSRVHQNLTWRERLLLVEHF